MYTKYVYILGLHIRTFKRREYKKKNQLATEKNTNTTKVLHFIFVVSFGSFFFHCDILAFTTENKRDTTACNTPLFRKEDEEERN